MAQERRRHKRLDLEVSVELERLDEGGVTTLKYATVNVVDISKSGVGFTSNEVLEVGSFYDVKLQIWTKEVINAVVEIVRRSFVGMPETDSLKIEIYQIFNEFS